MLPPPGEQQKLSTRVDQWMQQIAEEISKSIPLVVQNKPQAHKGGQDLHTSTSRYQTRLQARLTTQQAPLAETSSNPRLRQRRTLQNKTIATPYVTRKRGRSIQGDEEIQRGGKRQRGRPRKGLNSESGQRAAATFLPDNIVPLLPDLSIRPSEASPRRRKSQSPRKRTDTNLDQAATNANITLAFLETCTPSVQLLSYDEVRSFPDIRTRMSPAVESLHQRLQRIPSGLIPLELKVARFRLFFSRRFTNRILEYI